MDSSCLFSKVYIHTITLQRINVVTCRISKDNLSNVFYKLHLCFVSLIELRTRCLDGLFGGMMKNQKIFGSSHNIYTQKGVVIHCFISIFCNWLLTTKKGHQNPVNKHQFILKFFFNAGIIFHFYKSIGHNSIKGIKDVQNHWFAVDKRHQVVLLLK